MLKPSLLPASTRRFGLEVEFAADPESQSFFARVLERVLNRWTEPFVSSGYDHSDGSFWHLKTDSSCGLELATPALTWEKWPIFEEVLEVLELHDAIIDERCGIHVHHDLGDFTEMELRRLVLLWAAHEQAITLLVAPDRENNRYCQSVVTDVYGEIKELMEAMIPLSRMSHCLRSLGKYRTLNCSNWWRNGTVEVRLHHGSLDAEALKFWTLFTQRVVEIGKVERDLQGLTEVWKLTGATQLLKLQERLKRYKADDWDEYLSESLPVVAMKQRPGLKLLEA